MSLHQLANHMSARGRGPDSTLVHMSPREVEGLQKLAVAHGTSLTINPDTGLPEAFSLESLLPTLAGAALNYFLPGVGTAIGEVVGLGSAAGTGLAVGAATAALTGDLGKGLSAGLGAYGGAGITDSLAGMGAAQLGSQAVEEGVGQKLSDQALQESVANRMASATMSDKVGAGLSYAGSNPMSALKIGGKYLAAAAAPLFAGEVGNTVQTVTKRPSTAMIRPYRYDPYEQTFEEGTPYAAAKGGLMGLAHGGAVRRFDEGGLTLDQMYKNVLGREADTGGRDFWKSQFGDTVDNTELAAFRQSALGGTSTADKSAAQNFGIGNAGAGFAATAPVTPVGMQAEQAKQAGQAPHKLVTQAPAAQDFGATSNNTGAMASVGNNVMGTGASGSSIGQNAVVNKAAQATTEMAAPVRDARADEAAFTAAGNAANNTGIASLANTTGASNNVVSQQQPSMLDQVQGLYKNVLDRTGPKPYSLEELQYWSKEFGDDGVIDANEVAKFKSAAQKEIDARTADFASSQKYIPISKLDDLYMQELSRHGEYGKDGKEGGMEFWQRTFGDYINPEELAGFRTEAAKERAAREKATRPAVVTDLTTADTTYIKPGVGGSTGAGQIGGGTVINPNGTITTSPVIPGIPVGGFKGMDQVRNAYTTGGGSLGYTSYAPKTIDEFNTKYKNTGYQKEMYDYLMGRGDKPTKMKNADGTFREIMRPYKEATLGVPGSTNKRLTWDPVKGEYFRNPDYVRTARAPILDADGKQKRDADGNYLYNTTTYKSINQAKAGIADNKLTKDSGSALFDWATQNNIDEQTVADALGIPLQNVLGIFSKAKADKKLNVKNGGLMSLASGGMAYDNGGSVKPDFTNSKGEVFLWDWENGIYRPKEMVKDGKTYTWDKLLNSYKLAGVGAGIASLVGGDGGSPAGGENPAARPEGSYDISRGTNPYTGSINALANGPAGTAVGKIAGLFGPQVSLNNAPVVDIAGTPTQAAKDYGKSSWGKTGDEGQDIGTVAPKGSTSTTESDVFASITRDVAARAAAAGMTTAEFAEKGLAEVSARAQADRAAIADAREARDLDNATHTPNLPERQAAESYEGRFGPADRAAAAQAQALAESNDRPGSGGVAEGNYGEGLAGGYEKANGGMIGHYAQGGLGSLGGYSDGGRLLRGPGDGVSDSIPASIGNRQPARLADGEFVVPARIVSELGNGSTEAGARALYKMMARIQANRRKTTGKNRVAVDSKSHKYLPA